MSDTPRTDEVAYKTGYFHQHEVIPASLGRELERENARLREWKDDAKDLLNAQPRETLPCSGGSGFAERFGSPTRNMSNDKHSSAAPALGVAVGSAQLEPQGHLRVVGATNRGERSSHHAAWADVIVEDATGARFFFAASAMRYDMKPLRPNRQG